MASISLDNIKYRINSPRSKFWLAVVAGSAIVCAWTLIWFFNRPANFDQVGQLVLAHQWLNGQHTGSVIGPTNYILKILLLYIPADLLPVSAQLKLIIITLLINIATYILFLVGLDRVWRLFNYPGGKISYNPFIYLAVISGSVFWMSFSNSRNLEIAGGIFLIYLYLKTQAKPTRRNYIFLSLLASFLFFADPLQIYMTLLPILIFSGLRLLRDKDRSKRIIFLKILGLSAAGIIAAKLITKMVEKIWGVSFIANSQSTSLSLSSLRGAAGQTARLYAGGHETGRACQALNLLVVLTVLTLTAWIAWRQKKSRPILLLAGCLWLADLAIYIVSGQAQQPDTSRYLIMTVPAFCLMAAVVLKYFKHSVFLPYAVGFVLAFNVIGLSRAFSKAWDPRLGVDAHDRSAISYIESNHYAYAYASINTALAGDYLSNSKVNLLPLGCDPGHILKKANLFFDKSDFQLSEQLNRTTLVPLILDGDSITINPTTCTTSQITKQLGHWQSTDKLSDGSTVLLYSANQFQGLRSF